MPERWRSPAARKLAQAVRAAGGTIERAGVGKLTVTGPTGSLTINEPSSGTRRDLRRDSVARKIKESTGLVIAGE